MIAIADFGRSAQSHDGRHVMTVNSGLPRRQLGRVTLLLAIVGGTAVLALPSSQAASTCFGKAATIADQVDDIQGTPGNDVIIGD